MSSLEGFAELLTRIWQSCAHKAREVPSHLVDDFYPGYHNAILALGQQYGITWTSDEVFSIEPPAGSAARLEPSTLVDVLVRLLEEQLRNEEEDRQLPEDHQAPGYFLGNCSTPLSESLDLYTLRA